MAFGFLDKTFFPAAITDGLFIATYKKLSMILFHINTHRSKLIEEVSEETG